MQQGEIKIAMAATVVAILSAAGFTAVDRNDDLSPFDVRVIEGPATRTPPAWLPVAER